MHILSLQPYYGGSHKAFQTEWQSHSELDWTVLWLPPRHWKWRMRHAAVHFAEHVGRHAHDNIELIFCSDFLNFAEFRGLAPRSVRDLPIVVYFHENQFAYPSRRYDERDLHFGFTNFTSCLAADEVWFNSGFNRDSFMQGLEIALAKWPDFPPRDAVDSLPKKFRIEPPGIRLPSQKFNSNFNDAEGDRPIVLTWAARWEHDKNPEGLLHGLRKLKQNGVEFKVNVIGESFRRVPEPFEIIKQEFAAVIGKWGFLESRDEYWETLAHSDIFISTADHEFFGIAAAEAIAAGAMPLLPDRLAYPELLNVESHPSRRDLFLYDGTPTDMAQKIGYLAKNENRQIARVEASQLTRELCDRLDWQLRGQQMDSRLKQIAEQYS